MSNLYNFFGINLEWYENPIILLWVIIFLLLLLCLKGININPKKIKTFYIVFILSLLSLFILFSIFKI